MLAVLVLFLSLYKQILWQKQEWEYILTQSPTYNIVPISGQVTEAGARDIWSLCLQIQAPVRGNDAAQLRLSFSSSPAFRLDPHNQEGFPTD